jgi:hypothetical protein
MRGVSGPDLLGCWSGRDQILYLLSFSISRILKRQSYEKMFFFRLGPRRWYGGSTIEIRLLVEMGPM